MERFALLAHLSRRLSGELIVYAGLCRPYVPCQYVQTSPQKPLGRLKPGFMWSLLGTGEMKVYSNGPGHMTKVAAMPMYDKSLKNLLLRNHKVDDLKTLYAALGAQVLPNLFKRWHWVDLDLFYDKVKFGPLSFCMGKR